MDNKKYILCVDDVEDNIFLYSIYLKEYNNVLYAESGNDAITQYKKYTNNIYMIFMDYQMPGLSGDKTLKILRTLGYTGNCILVTAACTENTMNDVKSQLTSEFDIILPKPIKRDSLLQYII